jgi:hypothetical protein
MVVAPCVGAGDPGLLLTVDELAGFSADCEKAAEEEERTKSRSRKTAVPPRVRWPRPSFPPLICTTVTIL